jgi:hypothetical protein
MVDENQPPPPPRPQVRALQFIVAAMTGGALALLVIAAMVPARPMLPTIEEARPPVISYIALACGVAAIFGGQLLSNLIVSAGRRKLAGLARTPPEKSRSTGGPAAESVPPDTHSALLALFTAKTIIGAAVDEAAALFLGVAFLLEGLTACATLAAVMIVALLLRIPSRDRAHRWLEEQNRIYGQ